MVSLTDKRNLFAESVEANKNVLLDVAVTLVDSQDGMAPSSGTLLSIGTRFFVATASHVIPSNPNGRLWLLESAIHNHLDGFPQIVSRHRSPEDQPDVGLLELHPEGVRKYFSRSQFCSLDDVAIVGIGRAAHTVIVTGAPSERVKVTRADRQTIEYCANVLPFGTFPLMQDEWPKPRGNSRALDPDVDIVLSYPTDEELTDEGHDPINLPNPKGMSGGGIWDQGFHQKELWTPRSMQLIGIQSSWDRKQRYLRGVQIIHWVRLLHEHYPDLRPILEDKFGDEHFG